jgi:hypothetical protein
MKWTCDWSSNDLTSADWAAWDAVIAQSGKSSVHLDSRCVRALLKTEGRQAAAVRWWGSKGELVGIAVVEDAHAESHNLEGHLEADNRLFRWAYDWLHGPRRVLRFPLRVMGPLLGSGDHAYRFLPSISTAEARDLVTSTLLALPLRNGFKPRAFLIKDFVAPEDVPERIAGGRSWHRKWVDLEFDPLMRIPINPEWTALEHYMGELKTKARTKVKRILTCSGDCEIEELTFEEVEEHANLLESLYKLVYEEAGFRLGELRAADLVQTKSTWQNHFRISVLRVGGEILGFQCGFITPETVEAFFVGFDRNQHKELALYQRMLVEFIRWGIEAGSREVVMGRTALDIKSSVGAMPERLYCAVRFPNPVLHLLARMAARFSHPSFPALKRPWKQDAYPVSGSVAGQVEAPVAARI